jgi:hypothetical protein
LRVLASTVKKSAATSFCVRTLTGISIMDSCTSPGCTSDPHRMQRSVGLASLPVSTDRTRGQFSAPRRLRRLGTITRWNDLSDTFPSVVTQVRSVDILAYPGVEGGPCRFPGCVRELN